MSGRVWAARIAAAVFMTTMSAGSAFALDAPALPPPVPLVVDLEGVLEHSKAGQSVTEQLTAHNKIFEKEHVKQEEKLKQMQQELEQQRTSLSQDTFEQKYSDFQQHVQAWQQEEQLNEQALGQATEVARDKTLVVLKGIIDKIALDRHANLVLLKSQVFVYATAYDISQEVLDQLDEKLPTLKVVIPKLTPQGQAGSEASQDSSGQ
jgi:Skp family chaperone for outer membrane proteins